MRKLQLILVIFILVGVGCVSAPPPTLEEDASDQIIEIAEPTEVATNEPVVSVEDKSAEAIGQAPDRSTSLSTSPAVSENAYAGEGEYEGEPNRLLSEKSPYLLQHAYNPVDWHAWGDEAFEKARIENKPIFLSIGYSTCHWCHVMKRESFEDSEVADLMNETFINIKVDREERPDIDGVYMTVAQIMGERGGWPLTIMMTPDQLPFFSATYIPKETRFQRVGMMELIPQIDTAWETQQTEILNVGNQIVERLQSQNTGEVGGSGVFAVNPADVMGTATTDTAYAQLNQRFDPEYGGFSVQPKFPSPHNLLFLLRYWDRTGDPQALTMVETTLQNMRLGGVYDQIGYGFHRYSTDREWKLPHFEKMLYDQAMLAMAYTETYQATEDEQYAQVVDEIFTYVLRDMTDEGGGFYSAENADSEDEFGHEEEGIFYYWTIDEIRQYLSPQDANLVIRMSGMSAEGNFLEEATGQTIGENVIFWDEPPAELATAMSMTQEQVVERMDVIRETLFEIREGRIRPSLDDKILTDWNGLMIAAFAKAGQTLDEPAYTEAARNSADFVLATMRNEEGRLLHRYRDGEAAILANIDDYAFMIWGLLELYEATFDLKYLESAIALNEELDVNFWDPVSGGYYFTPNDGEQLISRQKEIYDGAIPSGNSITMLNLLKLGRVTADASYEARAHQLSEAFRETIEQNPTAYTQLMSGLEFGVGPSFEVIIIGEEGAADTEALLSTLRDQYVPNKVVLLRGKTDDGPLTQLADYTKYYYTIDDQATVYVCQNYVCEFPTTDPEQMVSLLKKRGE